MSGFFESIQPFVQVAQAITAIVAVCTLVVGVATLWKSIVEYRRSNALKSFDKFQEMRKRFEETESLKVVCQMIASSDKRLDQIDYRMKEDFLGFYEEIALMNNSDLINDRLTHYMFGYYALRAVENENFKNEINLESMYWSLFVEFCKKMKTAESKMVSMPHRHLNSIYKLRF